MLKELRITNLAIIDDLSVRFENGLNILSGETGAGKSIIVDALGLALGDRAQSDLIKSGEKEATVQAYFELDDSVPFSHLAIDSAEGLIIRRVLTAAGKSRAYINDSMVTIQTLSDIGKLLVDIHSQHEHQSLLTADKQRSLLDFYGKHQTLLEKIMALFNELQVMKREMTELTGKSRERAQRLDLLRYQVNEIDSAALMPGEYVKLEEEKKILSNMTKLNELIESAYSLLYGDDGSCTESLSKVITKLQDVHSIDGSIEETLKLLESAAPLIEDASATLRGFRNRYDLETGRIDIVEERLDTIKKLERKYGEGIEGIKAYRDNAEKELRELECSDERLEILENEINGKQDELREAAKGLSEKRKQIAKKIDTMVEQTLKELAFSEADFKIDVRQDLGNDGNYLIGSSGMDRVEFLFSANPGEPLKPLSRIISGGELSRVMLALKSILAEVDNIPVLIFDEVDAGIGGKTAESVGKKLAVIAKKHQLLCITHLPQIASFGNFHLKIEKKVVQGRVRVAVKELVGKDRQDEIARMLSGKVTDISLKHAGELLERVK